MEAQTLIQTAAGEAAGLWHSQGDSVTIDVCVRALGPGSPLSQLSWGLQACHAPQTCEDPLCCALHKAVVFFRRHMCYTSQHTRSEAPGRAHDIPHADQLLPQSNDSAHKD